MPTPKRYKHQKIINCASCKHFFNRNINGDPGTQCDKYTKLTPHKDTFVDFEPIPNGYCDDWSTNE